MKASFALFVMAGLMSMSRASPSSSCGPNPKTAPAGCVAHTDLGSCGNACCVVEFALGSKTSRSAYETVSGYLKKGGSDGSYEYVTGPDAAGHNPSDDLTSFPIPVDFIFQGKHTTQGGFIDTLNFYVTNSTIVRAGSISGIHGAYGDAGQNFHTLDFLQNDLGGNNLKVVHGCGGKK